MRLQPRTLFAPTPASPSQAGAQAADAAEPAYSEPQFSRALLFSLLALLIAAQVAFEGVRFGLNAPHDSLALPLLRSLRGAATGVDPIGFVLAACASPFWWLLARIGEGVPQSALFSGVFLLARVAGALAVFRLAERAFGHALGALLSAALWLGISAGSPHDFLAPAGVALALWLWAVVLWHEDRPAWALLCGAAVGVDVLSSLFVFALLWATAWLRPFRATPQTQTPRASWRKWQRGAGDRLSSSVRALGWFALGALPALLFWAPRAGKLSALAKSSALAISAWPQESPRALWPLVVLLVAGAWCWRASLQVAALRTLAFASVSLGAAAAAASWLFSVQSHGSTFIAALARLAPLALACALLAIAHTLERSASRRGSSGLLGLLALIGLAIFGRAPLLLVFGIVLIEGTGRLARQSPKGNQRRFAGRDKISTIVASAGRWALLAFVLLACARARLAVGARLQNGDGVLSARQNHEWRSAQDWMKANAPAKSVVLAEAPGFRAFGGRAVFLDADDEKLTALSPQFGRVWRARYPLAAPLWKAKVRPDSGVLLRLRAAGVTHIVARSGDAHLAQWQPFMRPIYRNREWTIYRVRSTSD